jgi:hypothetical protein
LISLNWVVEGSKSDNLTKVIKKALMIGGGVVRDKIAKKLICFGVNGVNVFQGARVVLQNKSMRIMLFVLKVHCMAHRTNLAVQTLLGLPPMI